MGKDYFEEAIKALEESNLSEEEKHRIICKARKQANRIFGINYERWQKYQREKGIVGKYTDEEIIRRFFNKILYKKLKEREEEEKER